MSRYFIYYVESVECIVYASSMLIKDQTVNLYIKINHYIRKNDQYEWR